ncbi:hypothetical protein Tco_0989997 [Tanacetum coccineum]|uniref:CCHC-type domain-containing protein n=1 Tax=Tanacetum coccineum TaxID=301880 RepID=A0ABQ5EV98_9ASTR
MFALTVSTAEPKTIKEAMADSAWISRCRRASHLTTPKSWNSLTNPLQELARLELLDFIVTGNGYLRKGRKTKPKRQNRARERKERDEKPKSKSQGGLVDKIVRDPNKIPDSSQRPPQNCARCGNPVDGPYCRGCALLRKKFKEDLFTYCVENGIFQDLQDTSESSNDNTNVVNAPQDPFVVKEDPGKNSSQSPPHIDHNCCYECGDSLDGIFCQRCTCKSCGKGAHHGYNCPPKVPIIYNPRPYNNQTIDELPQTLPRFDPTCYSERENSLPYVSKPNFVDDSHNVFNPPSQPPTYSYAFCGNDAYYGYDCPPQSEDFSDIESECDMPDCDNFTTFSNLLFDANDDFSSSDDESFSDEDVLNEIYSNPLFDEEIISVKIDASIISMIDSLLEQFSGELAHNDLITPGINEADFDLEEDIRFIERLLYDNSSPRPSEAFQANSDTIIESLPTFLIPVEGSDSLR